MSTNHPYIDALQWHLDEDIDTPLDDMPVDRRISSAPMPVVNAQNLADLPQPVQAVRTNPAASGAFAAQKAGVADIARACNTLEDLSAAIAAFDGLDVKRTATNMVFGSGNAKAKVMIIGEAPADDDDRQGVSFAGVQGALLDKMFACINLARGAEAASDSFYASNILNWRPPGNRTPTDAEMALSLPFIERHIALINPDYVVLMGTLAAKTLLNTDQSMSRIRGKFHDYQPLSHDIGAGLEPAQPKMMATYHPSYLLASPAQKRQAWQDLLMLQSEIMKNK